MQQNFLWEWTYKIRASKLFNKVIKFYINFYIFFLRIIQAQYLCSFWQYCIDPWLWEYVEKESYIQLQCPHPFLSTLSTQHQAKENNFNVYRIPIYQRSVSVVCIINWIINRIPSISSSYILKDHRHSSPLLLLYIYLLYKIIPWITV